MKPVAVLACRYLIVLLTAFATAGPAMSSATQPASTMTQTSIPYARHDVLKLAEKVADHQLQMHAAGPSASRLVRHSFDETNWVQAALFVGLRDLSDRSPDPKYRDAIMARGKATGWQLGRRAYHADDHAIGQAYLWAAVHGAGPAAVAPMKERFDHILAEPPVDVGLQHGDRGDKTIPDCRRRWCWSDALFMAPPVWIELSRLTGDPRYAVYAKAEFLAVTDYLYDREDHLYYRDSRFFGQRGPDGEKVFWSRGNGWVLAGLARIIPMLTPGDPARSRMETIFRDMSARLVGLQKSDGYWSPSLLANPGATGPETSGTGFFTYGLAWGIKAGLLDRAMYEPSVRKGWGALVQAVHPDGLLGYVQPIGDRPDHVSFHDTQFYGGGAFLLAATAVADLDLAPVDQRAGQPAGKGEKQQ